MKDFNFFEYYTGTRKDFKRGYLYATILSIGIALLIVFTFAFNYINIRILNSDIADIQKNLNLKENVVKLKQAEDEEKKLDIMNKYYDIVVNTSEGINSNGFLASKAIDEINSCVPEGVFFKVITLDSSGVQLEAEGKDRETIAVFERALKNLDNMKDVNISTINSSTSENKNLTFSLKCILKDVDNYEGN